MKSNLSNLKFDADSGLIPVIIQDDATNKVLMLGYMNQEALSQTQSTKQVTFYSRSKQRLWTKGETSGHFLSLISIATDCDNDTLLIKVIPHGPTCHEGYDTCFQEENKQVDFMKELEGLIIDRKNNPRPGSYTTSLFESGVQKIAQKVGEEAVETILEAQSDNTNALVYEASDMIYHLLVLLQAKDSSWQDVLDELIKKHQKK
ncbi:MAG: bifunctional phosphoribosyl-AMP cyclohydrolase/phosphoribosyl-ATP diphosphatase HisIE [Saprospiraceae bacterium]